MAINPIPERTINYRVYNDSNDILGMATVDLPDIEAMTDTVSGAGIAGEVESPTLGHFGSMETTINWRTITENAVDLYAQKQHHLEFRSAQQISDVAAGTLTSQQVRLVMRCVPKNLELGSLEASAATDSSSTFEVVYLKIFIDGKEVIEIDKYNFKYVVNGEDLLQVVRQHLGIE